MGIESWSTTPASNNDAPPDGAPEGMAPSAVNNVIRQQMADHRAQWNDAEWFGYGDGEGGASLTYVAADQFKVEGVDVSTAYHVGRRVRVVGTGTGTIYGVINAVAFSIDTTVTVTFDTGSMSNETLTVSLGIMSAQNEAMKLDAQRLVKGVIEANANFVDFVVFGPALDPVKDWHKRLGSSVATSLMLATVEDTGADTEVNVWDLTDAGLVSGTPLATVTLTGAATPTSIDAAMGYIIVGSEDGVSIIEPHDGAWAERTEGWPKSLSTSTTPALGSNSVLAVAAGYEDQPSYDPRTQGPMPTFGIGLAANATGLGAVMKSNGTFVHSTHGSGSGYGSPYVSIEYGRIINGNLGSDVRIYASPKIGEITAALFAINSFNDVGAGNLFAVQDGTLNTSDNFLVRSTTSGLDIVHNPYNGGSSGATAGALIANINRTYNTGWMPMDIRGAWLANSKTADRSYKANTLTENGTVTEAAAESGAEVNGYSGWSASNYLSRAFDADFDFDASADWATIVWAKRSSGGNIVYDRRNTGAGSRYYLGNDGGGNYNAGWEDASTNTSSISGTGGEAGDGLWHMIVSICDQTNDQTQLWIDGALAASDTSAGVGTFANGTATLQVGMNQAGGASPWGGDISLFRITATIPTAAQIRHMYETERRMFEANAKYLLQSGTTDAVLDVSIDPITGKVGVVQTDDEVLFDGLVIDEEPALPSGGASWEHVARYGGDRLVITNANLYADIAAKDIREELEELRGKVSALPKGPDLGRAKAWISFQGAAATINASYNIKSLSRAGAGDYQVTFEVPFKSNLGAIPVCGGQGSADDRIINCWLASAGAGATAEIQVYDISSAGFADANQITVTWFGELENE